jgi:hypothetical protein
MEEQQGGPFEKFVDSPYYSIYDFETWVERCKKEVHCLPREVIRKRDGHRTSTKFRLGVIR